MLGRLRKRFWDKIMITRSVEDVGGSVHYSKTKPIDYGQFKYDYLFKKNVNPTMKYNDQFDKHKQLVSFSYLTQFIPKISGDTFIAPNATLCGNVEVWSHSSIWYGVVVRGDTNLIRIGSYTNIQDNTVITEAHGPIHEDHDGSTIVGHFVTVGHDCQLSACTIEDNCLVGMHSILCSNSYMEKESILAANSLLSSGSRIPSGQMWAGKPAKFIRNLTNEETHGLESAAIRYWEFSTEHIEEFFLPIGTNYIEAQKINPHFGCRVYEPVDPLPLKTPS